MYGGPNKELRVMSIGFLLPDRTAPVVWRGPKKTSVIGQFVREVNWGDDLDWLIVDTPPGTSDEHLTVASELKAVSVLLLLLFFLAGSM